MTKKLIAGASLLIAGSALAADYPTMVFDLSDGSSIELPSDGLSMVFRDNKLVATSSDGTQEIALDKLSSFHFVFDPAALSDIAVLDGEVEVFNTLGVSFGRFASANEARTALAPGVYIFKTENRTCKTVIK